MRRNSCLFHSRSSIAYHKKLAVNNYALFFLSSPTTVKKHKFLIWNGLSQIEINPNQKNKSERSWNCSFPYSMWINICFWIRQTYKIVPYMKNAKKNRIRASPIWSSLLMFVSISDLIRSRLYQSKLVHFSSSYRVAMVVGQIQIVQRSCIRKRKCWKDGKTLYNFVSI